MWTVIPLAIWLIGAIYMAIDYSKAIFLSTEKLERLLGVCTEDEAKKLKEFILLKEQLEADPLQLFLVFVGAISMIILWPLTLLIIRKQ